MTTRQKPNTCGAALAAALTFFLLLFLIPGSAFAQVTSQSTEQDFSEFDGKAAFEYSQAAIGGTVGDYTFLDPDGREVKLSDFEGKPVIISLIYTSCYHTCPLITNNLIRAIGGSRGVVAWEDYTVLTIGFDTRVDTPRQMGIYATERGIDFPNWHILSADAETIANLSRDLGFIFFPSPKGFDHLAQTTVLTQERKVFRHIYTSSFEAPFLVEPLKELIYGAGPRVFKLGHFIEQVKLFCTFFDPKTGRYRFDYSLFIAIIIGSLSLFAIAVFLIREWFFKSRP